MFLIEQCVRRPVTVAVGVILVGLFGTIALVRMPMQLTPDVETPVIEIETRWPGASPQEIEREIIEEQEEQLQGIEGVRKMSSESVDSLGKIILEFDVDADMSKAMLLVNTRLQQVREYPIDADQPVISPASSTNRFIAWFMLGPKTPTPEDFAAFEQKYPQLVDKIARAKGSHSSGLMRFRLNELAETIPEIRELMPEAMDVTKLRRFAENSIEARFERVEGVAASNVLGGREDELQVIVDPQRLAARQLTIGDVRDALRANNKDTSGGDFWEGKRRYVVRTLGQFRSPVQVANTIVARRDGMPVYVRDVAEVQLGFKKPDGMVRRMGATLVAINVQRENQANVLEVMKGLKAACQELNETVLKHRGLELVQAYDETEYIYSSIGLVTDNIIEAGVLTFIVLLLFLRSVRSSVVVFLAIAVSVIGMFLVLGLMKRSLNVLSLAGIAFAVGMLVDNFIVVLENIYRHYQSGETALSATVRGTKDVWGAVVTATLANLAVFVPVLFVGDEAGQLFRDIALAVSAALLISLIAALLIVPTAASRVLKHMPHETPDEASLDSAERWRAQLQSANLSPLARRVVMLRAGWDWFHRRLVHYVLWPLDAFGRGFVKSVVNINAWIQQSLILRLATVGVFVFGAAFLIWVLMPKAEYLPSGNRNLVFGILLPPPGYNIDQLTKMGEQVESALRPYWDVDPGSEEEKKLDYPMIRDVFFVARGKQLFMGIRSYDPLRSGELEALVRQMGRSLPGTITVAKQASLFEAGLGKGRTVDIEITGPEVTKLIELGGKIMFQVGSVIPGTQARPIPSLDLSSPEMHVVPRWEQAADMQMSATELGYAVDALVDGAYATDYFIGGEKIDLRIIGEDAFADQTQDLGRLPVAMPTGQVVSLDAVAAPRLSSGPEQINRRERQRAITIEVTPPADFPVEDAMDRIASEIVAPLEASGALEGGEYKITLAGTAEKLGTTWNSLKWNLALAVLITYLIMAALFESWLYPFVIMMSVPLGAVGGFAGLQVLNWFLPTPQPLDVLTMLGFIILVGTVVNNPILIVEQALVHIREDDMPPRQAILESVSTRIRPIFMTAFIGFFGLLPLVISPGAGSELYRGLGSVLLGGLLLSTIFTLVLVPTLFSLTLEARESFQRLWGRMTLLPPVPVPATPAETVATNGEHSHVTASLRREPVRVTRDGPSGRDD